MGVQHVPTAWRGSGTRRPVVGGSRTHLDHSAAPCCPTPNRPCPPGPAVLQLEPGSDAAGGAAPRPALPAPPNQSLSKGWSSKIFSRAPSVYHTVNLGFQQLYDAAGRWERTKKRCFALSDTACVCQCPQHRGSQGTGPACQGDEDRNRGPIWVRDTRTMARGVAGTPR